MFFCFIGNTTAYAYDILLQNGESSIIKYGNVSGQTETLKVAVTNSLLMCSTPQVNILLRYKYNGLCGTEKSYLNDIVVIEPKTALTFINNKEHLHHV